MTKFSPQRAIELLQTGTYSVFPGVPTMFHYILQRAQELSIEKLGKTRVFISAGAIMPAALNRSFEETFNSTLLRLRHHRDLYHGDHELDERRAPDGIVRIAAPVSPFASSIR